jgi:hypothetical protein
MLTRNRTYVQGCVHSEVLVASLLRACGLLQACARRPRRRRASGGSGGDPATERVRRSPSAHPAIRTTSGGTGRRAARRSPLPDLLARPRVTAANLKCCDEESDGDDGRQQRENGHFKNSVWSPSQLRCRLSRPRILPISRTDRVRARTRACPNRHCPLPFALCPLPFALCPLPSAPLERDCDSESRLPIRQARFSKSRIAQH